MVGHRAPKTNQALAEERKQETSKLQPGFQVGTTSFDPGSQAASRSGRQSSKKVCNSTGTILILYLLLYVYIDR